MSLRFVLKNYKAVQSADITLSDLTVLAGVNASGKSTLAKVVHSAVEISRNHTVYEGLYAVVESNLVKEFKTLVGLLEKVKSKARDSVVEAFLTLFNFGGAGESRDAEKLFQDARLALLDNKFRKNVDSDKRILESFNRALDTKIHTSVELVAWFDSLVKAHTAYRKKMEDPTFKSRFYDFALFLRNAFRKSDDDTELQIYDSGVEIFDSNRTSAVKTNYIVSPVRSIYLNDARLELPCVDDGELKVGYDRYELRSKPFSENLPSEWKSYLVSAWNGTLTKPAESKDEDNKWVFSHNGLTTVIPFAECADGIKSMAALVVLDKYGLLDSDTLLLIDEPEVHLHPQWIVSYAKIILSLVAKEKVRVMLTTHSPYLIRALRQLSIGVLKNDQLNFHLMEQKGGGRYECMNLGLNIAPIFKAFNVALDQIAFYQD